MLRRNRQATLDADSRIDYGIIFSVMLLSVIGISSIYVALSHDGAGTNMMRTMLVQGAWYLIGWSVVFFIMQFDAEQLWKIAPLAYGLGITLLYLVLIFYSRSYYVNTGAKSWFAFGPVTFQPSEVMKPAYILMMARVITQHNADYPEHTVRTDWKLLFRMVAWTLPVIIALKLQNDFGTTLVFCAIFGGLVIISGITWKIIGPIIAIFSFLGTTAIILVVYNQDVLEKLGFKVYQFERVQSWLNPSGSTSGSAYQLWQSMKAIGSGQLFGKGFNVSTVYVPVRESDMIFSVIGENFGFIGGCVLIFIYLVLIFQMIQVTFDTKNEFYAYLSTGVIMMILFHVFENIGMSIGLLPLTGIPLPFISQGGSSLLGNMIGVGFVMSMRYHNKSYMFSSNQKFQ